MHSLEYSIHEDWNDGNHRNQTRNNIKKFRELDMSINRVVVQKDCDLLKNDLILFSGNDIHRVTGANIR